MEPFPEECSPNNTAAQPMGIVIIVYSVVITWLELWVFIYQVIPKERRDEESKTNVAVTPLYVKSIP